MRFRLHANGRIRGAMLPTLVAIVGLVLVGCAGPRGRAKSGGLEPFAEGGATEEAARGKRYALVIGIEEFEDESFGDLEYAVEDAEAVGDALSDFDAVIRKTDAEETDRSDLLAAVERLGDLADDPGDVAFIYVSTHGTLGRKPGGPLERYLVASDTKLQLAASTGIRVEDLMARMEKFASERTALVLATCHSGSGKSKISDELAEALAERKSGSPPSLRSVSEATIMLSAASFDEPARELDSLEHDIYTHFFLEALDAGDRDGNGAVTVSEAHDYARRRTYAHTDGEQRPTAFSSILGRDPIVLSGKPTTSGKPVVYSYERSARDVSMEVDGNTKGMLPGGVALEPGAHRLELRNSETGETLWRGRVRLDRGERVEVSELIPPPSSWEFRLQAGGFGAVAGRTRRQYLPVGGAVGVRAALLREPWSHAFFEVRGTAFRSRGTVSAFDTDLGFAVRGGHVALGGGGLWRLGSQFDVQLGADAGMLWASRSFDDPSYVNPESLRAPTFGATAALTWRFLKHARVTVRADAGLLRAALGVESAFHPYGSATLGFGVGF